MWDTTAEITFLAKIGTGEYTDPTFCKHMADQTRLILLKKYRHAMHLRHRWDAIQPQIIEETLWRMISAEERAPHGVKIP